MTRSRSKPRRQSCCSCQYPTLTKERPKGKRRLTRSIAALSSSVTLISCAPGGSGVSPSVSSASNCRNCSGFWPINAASCGLPAPTCCRIGSSMRGCVCTIWRSCWNCGFARRKSRLPAPPPAVASCTPWAAFRARAVSATWPRPGRLPVPEPRLAWAAASKRLTGASGSVGVVSVGAAGVAPVAAGVEGVFDAGMRRGAACCCSCWTFSGMP
jgi:hypothetical protein